MENIIMVAYVISDVMIERKQNNNDYFNWQTLLQMLTHDHITTSIIILNFDHLFCFIISTLFYYINKSHQNCWSLIICLFYLDRWDGKIIINLKHKVKISRFESDHDIWSNNFDILISWVRTYRIRLLFNNTHGFKFA